MSNDILRLDTEAITARIFQLRDQQVMLDSDLAVLYGVETRVFNQAVKRNAKRFPAEFRFQIKEEELVNLRSQIVTSSETHGGRRYLPYAFTEQGVAMLSAVLRSETAIQTSIHIINAFVGMRRLLIANGGLIQRMDSLENRQVAQEIKTDERFEKVFKALESGNDAPTQGIFFNGQIFDAYVFINDLLRRAKTSIVLIDNYVDDSVLVQLAKRRTGVSASIYTKHISKQLALDLEKHNQQYSPITIQPFKAAHDRFLIIDEKEIYHIGASLKDLGKKWFAFSKFESSALDMLEMLKK